MEKMNSIQKSQYIDRRYKDYLRSSFQFGNTTLQKMFEEQLSSSGLFKGPYLDLNLPFQKGLSLNQLIEEGVVSKFFRNLGDMALDRPLYAHQETSIRHIAAGKSAVITTGTGSGKTESFLYPILNDLLKDIENGNHDIGIRAIFLYPMNALVNDQIDRVRKILSPYPEITYGFFTGDTKQTVSANYRKQYSEENDAPIPANELISRDEIRKAPPHLLFTNYSMLEYLLIRPTDYSVFEPSKLLNWKYVVLDEAHSYSGSKGIELSLLMRRVTGLAQKKPRFILTSATLGKQGESEDEIVDFATSLTSAPFDAKDIIFSKRKSISQINAEFMVSGDDYIQLKNNVSSLEYVTGVCNKYIDCTADTVAECLYDLFVKDHNVHKLYRLLKDGSRNFYDVQKEFEKDVSIDEMIVLIDLINLAEKDGSGLFDLKYHSFVRPLSGAYITLGDTVNLSLVKTNFINGKKAFEVGNCRYCSVPYIIGRIQYDGVMKLDYLLQNDEIDIYENYGNNEFVRLDYFLLENTALEDEVDLSLIEEHVVCTQCGAIHPKGNLNAVTCTCGESFSTSIYRVIPTSKKEKKELYNNINQCPCCSHTGKAGIVKGLNVGKDQGTSIISQILMEALDSDEYKPHKAKKLSLKSKQIPEKKETPKVKQFLTFSDSRQQASFSALFLDSNHVRLLQKRLIWQIIQDENYRTLPVDELAALLEAKIKTYDLFDNGLTAHKNAWVALLVDLLRVDGIYDGEGLGLYYFELDTSDIFNELDEETVNEAFGEYNVTKSDLMTIIQVVFSMFKTTPAISYTKSALTPEEKLEYLEYRRFDNSVMFNSPKALKGIRSFLPVNGKENVVVRYIKRVFKCDETKAKEILDIIFNNLAVESGLLSEYANKKSYQTKAEQYLVKNYHSSDYYRCSKCGRLTPYNVHGVCIQDKCEGHLTKVDPDVILANNYYREQYKNKKIERIIIKEHTAQIERKQAKQYQLDFKNNKINILSCSTTFEMGIDIGNLETVFMRNVPPSPANYVQRAGRAGRRKDSAAYILTFCGTGSHDYTYFTTPEKMISGVINPPYFNVVNEKIIVRHLMASCLGFFFRENPEYFKNINRLVFEDGVEKFKQYIESHPANLNEYINRKVLPEKQYEKYRDFKWFDAMGNTDLKLDLFVQLFNDIVEEYTKAQGEALASEDYAKAKYYQDQIESLQKQDVISSLSKHCVIPKYGFPVDLVDLQVYQDGYLQWNLDLTRDLKIALSEYAPDSEIIADGKKYTSKYITVPKTRPFSRYYFCTCDQCQKVNVSRTTQTFGECKYCGASTTGVESEFFIEPVHGFKTGVTKESAHMKPKRSYSGEVSYLGGGLLDERFLDIGNVLSVQTSTEDELLVLNKSTFYMCPTCGYSDIEKGRISPLTVTKKHKNYRQFDCGNEALEKLKLGHRFRTDVARFTIPLLVSNETSSYAKALSFMYAFLEGVSRALEIERTDIEGVLELNLKDHSYDILLYDNVPGGAGHVKRLLNKDAVLRSLGFAHQKVSQQCCAEDTSCYNCLRNYYNQSNHNKLKRIYAKEFIEQLLTEIQWVDLGVQA